jgi:hypothetical protein
MAHYGEPTDEHFVGKMGEVADIDDDIQVPTAHLRTDEPLEGMAPLTSLDHDSDIIDGCDMAYWQSSEGTVPTFVPPDQVLRSQDVTSDTTGLEFHMASKEPSVEGWAPHNLADISNESHLLYEKSSSDSPLPKLTADREVPFGDMVYMGVAQYLPKTGDKSNKRISEEFGVDAHLGHIEDETYRPTPTLVGHI